MSGTYDKKFQCIRLTAAIGALKLETQGILVRRGPKVSTQFKRELGLSKHTKIPVIIDILQQQRDALHLELGIPVTARREE